MLEQDIKKILISQDEITEAAKKLGCSIDKKITKVRTDFSWNFKRIYSFYGRISQIY